MPSAVGIDVADDAVDAGGQRDEDDVVLVVGGRRRAAGGLGPVRNRQLDGDKVGEADQAGAVVEGQAGDPTELHGRQPTSRSSRKLQ